MNHHAPNSPRLGVGGGTPYLPPLDAPRRLAPDMRDGLTSTNFFVHIDATRAGAGIGFLPCFMADRHDDLVRLLPDFFREQLPYWMVLRPDSMRRPAVAAVANALKRKVTELKPELMGARSESSRIVP